MEKTEALIKIKEMAISEKMARLTEADFAYVQNCIEQTIQEEQNQQRENSKEETVTRVKKPT
jgi:hypothetical protein